MYSHSFSDGRDDVQSRMYRVEALPLFRSFVIDKWMPEKAVEYFKRRDSVALEYLPKLLER